MATDKSFVDFIIGQVAGAGIIESRKMFGEYMVYCDGRPVLLICDNQAFVKILPQVTDLFASRGSKPDTGFPYNGAKEHYILDADDADLAVEITKLLAKILPLPKRKKA
jgi:TfoX/Sxy family transcriptional regulator of competence genes